MNALEGGEREDEDPISCHLQMQNQDLLKERGMEGGKDAFYGPAYSKSSLK